jgi:hypothetical protein
MQSTRISDGSHLVIRLSEGQFGFPYYFRKMIDARERIDDDDTLFSLEIIGEMYKESSLITESFTTINFPAFTRITLNNVNLLNTNIIIDNISELHVRFSRFVGTYKERSHSNYCC